MMHVICILIVLALCGSAWSTALPNKFAHDALD